jgi:hypothetical protein
MTNLDLQQLLNYKTGKSVDKTIGMVLSGTSFGGIPAAANIATRTLKSKTLRDAYMKALQSGKIKPIEGHLQEIIRAGVPTAIINANKGNKEE